MPGTSGRPAWMDNSSVFETEALSEAVIVLSRRFSLHCIGLLLKRDGQARRDHSQTLTALFPIKMRLEIKTLCRINIQVHHGHGLIFPNQTLSG